ncbi:MAG: pyridoxal phosphate-dependent aminotransferase family protein [Cyclobacteriaceae bacterium]
MSQLLRNRFQSYRDPQDLMEYNRYPFFRMIESEQGTEVIVKGKKVLMFGSNSYLGLTTHPKIKEAAEAAVRKYGSSCAGSRFLNGTSNLHVELEERLADFFNKEAALLFSTGFQVNLGIIPTITTKKDIIILDRLNHASILEAAKLSSAPSVVYRHNDMRSLEQKLKHSQDADMRLIVVDGVFSMEGDIAKLPEIVALAKKYNAVVMSDCAHAVGVIGKNGAGTASHFGLDDDISIIGGTFSKSFASLGGFAAADKDTINYVKHNARSLIFSAAPTPASIAAATAALDIMESDDSLRLKLLDSTRYSIDRLNELGFDTGDTQTPIIPIYIRDNIKTYDLTMKLLERGVFVNPVVAPAVAPEDSLIRFSLMATHTRDQIDFAIDAIYEIAKELNINLSYKAA